MAVNPVPAPPLENSYRIPTGVGFAGQYPGDLHDIEARRKLNAILDAGVTIFIDLTEEDEEPFGVRMRPYDHLLREEASHRGIDVEYVRHPVPDGCCPKEKSQMRDILDALDDASRRGRLVYLHCWGGKGRTGTAVACHLVRRGSLADDALCQVQELARMMPRAKYARIPETAEQCRFVREWNASE